MIPTINVIIVDEGIVTRHEFQLDNILVEDLPGPIHLHNRYCWPEPFDIEAKNAIQVWTTFSLSEEERGRMNEKKEE